MMHIIFQRHHIPPDEFLDKPEWAQEFMMESMKLVLKQEEERRKNRKNK